MEALNTSSSGRISSMSATDSIHYDPNTDLTRPRYNRPKGEVGISLDVDDAATTNPRQFHSHHAMLSHMNELLYDLIHDVPLEHIKGAFLEADLLHGVILEQFHKGVILSVTLESQEALDNLWSAHAQGDIRRILQETLITPQVRQRAGVRHLELRVRLWEDERRACEEEWAEISGEEFPSLRDNAKALAMVNKVKDFKKSIPDQIWKLRDEQRIFEKDLSEMLRVLKALLTERKQTISSLAEYEKCCVNVAKSKPTVNMVPFNRYKSILASIDATLKDFNRQIFYPLSQVPSCYETAKQKQNKKQIRKYIHTSLQRTATSHTDISGLRHPEWQNRLLANEERFLGFVCLIPLNMDALVEVDECLDEYMSGFMSQ